jgi:hypothetical protein
MDAPDSSISQMNSQSEMNPIFAACPTVEQMIHFTSILNDHKVDDQILTSIDCQVEMHRLFRTYKGQEDNPTEREAHITSEE